MTRVTWGGPPRRGRLRPSPKPKPQAAEDEDWHSAARAIVEVEPVVPIPLSVTAEAKQARVVSHRSLVGPLATGLAPGELGTTYDATLARRPLPAAAVYSTPVPNPAV